VSELLGLFANNLLPILIAAGSGYLLSWKLRVDSRTLSQVVFYILSPCLIFSLLTQNQLSDVEILRMTLFTVSILAILGILAWVGAKFLGLERSMLSALLLVVLFNNSGNFGLPVVSFAFGQEALAFGALYFIANASLSYSLGVVIASMGRASLLQALTGLLKIPTIYGLLLALLFNRTGWEIPLFLDRTTELLGNASIPAMLVLLGMQLQSMRWGGNLKPLVLAVGARLVAAPLVALALSPIFGFQGLALQAGVLQASMPSAVLTTVIATEYNSEPSFVTAAVFMSTVLSPLTLTPLLAYLGG